MFKKKNDGNGEKIFRYSIRKYHFGAASVAVAALMFFANGTVQAQTPDISPATESEVARTSDVISSSSDGAEALSEKTSGKNPNQLEPSTQGNQESSDKNKSLVKDSEEGKKENQAEAISIVVDKSLAQSAQTSLQALLANLTLDSMKELHARVEESLARAKAVLDNPNSSQEEVNAQVQVMKALTEEVNKALAGGLTSPAQLGEGGSATTSEVSPTPRRGRGRRGQLTPPAMLAPAENQEIKETTEEVTDYTNGQGSYPLSEKIHTLLQELKISTENPEQVQKLKEAYDKLNEALGQSENGLVNQEVFNAALEEYKKSVQLKNGVEKSSSDIPKSRKERATDNSLKIGFGKGTTRKPVYSDETVRTLLTGESVGNNLRITAKSFSGKNIRKIEVTGLEGTGLRATGLTVTNELAYVDLVGRVPADRHGYTNITVVATDSSGNTNQNILTIARPLPDAEITTTTKELEGKAETKPIISGRLGVNAEPSRLPGDADLMAYLVRGGSTNPYSFNNEAQGYHTIAKTRISTSGTFHFVPSDYRDQKIGEESVRVVVAYVHRGTDTVYSEGMKSGFSRNSVRATAPIDRDGAKRELQTKANEKKASFNSIQHITEEEKRAANEKVDSALQHALGEIDKATTKSGVDSAKNAGLTAINGVSATANANAKQELDRKAQDKKAELAKVPHLTREELTEANGKVDEALRKAKEEVDKAKDQASVETAKTAGIGEISKVSATASANSTANQGNSSTPGNGGNQAGSDSRGDAASQGDRPAPSGDGSQGDANNQDQPTTPSTPAHSGDSTGQATGPSAQQRGTGNATEVESPQGLSGSSVTAPARSRRSVAFAGGAQSSQEKQVDKSVLRDLIQDLETRLKDLDGIDQSVIDDAKIILGEGQEALRNADLTEAGLREITAKVKEVLESLKGKQATKDEEEMQETSKEQGHLPYGTMIGSLLALLGLLLFLIARRKKESELKKLTKELTKVLQENDLTNVDAKVLDQAREALAQAVTFLANEKESDHTEDELIDKLKAILAQLG